MISELNKQRIKILSSKGHNYKSISDRTGITEKFIKGVIEPRNIVQLVGKKKSVRAYKTKMNKRPKSKHLLVREYIENTDTVYVDDMNKLGVSHVTKSLQAYEKHNDVKFIKLNEFMWDIKRG